MSLNYLPFVSAEVAPVRRGTRWQRAALVLVELWFAIGCIAHFLFADALARIVPPSIPEARDVVLIVGILEFAGVLGLLLPFTRRAAGWGLFVLTLCVTPANVYMVQAHERFDIPQWLLWLRLPLQVVLLWLIVWGSRWRAPRRPLY